MGYRLRSRYSAFKISNQTHLYKVFTFSRNVFKSIVIKMKLSFDNIMYNFRFIPSWKRYFSRQHDIKDNAHRPNIYFRIILHEKNFGCHVIWRAGNGVHRLAGAVVFAKTEINHFNTCQIIFFEQHEILRFYVPVRDVLRMQIFKGLKQLFHNMGCYVFV